MTFPFEGKYTSSHFLPHKMLWVCSPSETLGAHIFGVLCLRIHAPRLFVLCCSSPLPASLMAWALLRCCGAEGYVL